MSMWDFGLITAKDAIALFLYKTWEKEVLISKHCKKKSYLEMHKGTCGRNVCV